MKHYRKISEFYKKNTCSIINNISIASLVDLIYSDNNKKFILYDDKLYNQIIDNISVDWDNDRALIIAPENNYTPSAPLGFNKYDQHSLDYFSKIYSALKDHIKVILCAYSQENVKINLENYKNFTINKQSTYDECLDFCKKEYEKVDMVTGVNQYARRGGIIDIYPDISSAPKRILFLEEDTEIKEFNIETQISYKKINKLTIPVKINDNNLNTLIKVDSRGWNKFNMYDGKLVINNNINNKKTIFPFKKINYNQYKKIRDKHDVIYENINRMNGFIDNNGVIIVPEWFQKNSSEVSRNKIIDITEISIGDYVVHRDFGVGKFLGLKNISGNHPNENQELLIIKYQDNCSLSVDINHLDNITFYADKDHDARVDSLTKTGKWNKTKKIAIKNVQNIVNKLVNSYVNRENSYREPILAANDEKMFINEFEYLETRDQIKCWDDINNDLISNIPMDRLICGDVGFGKTEMAIRTAYRYASNSMKIIVLAPTTILAQQLFGSFNKRLKNYGVIIDIVSRFKTKKQVQKIKKIWLNNKLDIIVGTHAVLYDDIYLEGCNLLIIDEEHRFGVKQKEKIKDLNPGIDILTMSATPIPRTLNMALAGMKKISTLSSPPRNRKAIITNISYFNELLIINAINNEIYRSGQVYFVHNNVNTLPAIVGFLEKKLPHLIIDYMHGQMDSNIIEERMKSFTNKNIDVLVCTSIIENGIDISNTNTIIINNAHKFGLSQLYQIRGRVGRADKQAYAFLIIPNKIKLTSTAYSRLKSIEEYTNLGSGYKISNMDLTIRGGGSIFGYDQSGNIENVGYELVSKFINEYISQNNIINIKINFINKGIIPIEYIPSEKVRLLIYRKIKSVISLNELSVLIAELEDRFGNIPIGVKKIIDIQKIYILCKKISINSIEEKKNIIIIQFSADSWEQKISYLLNKINEFVNKQAINYEIKEFKESLLLKLKLNKPLDSIKLINTMINTLQLKV